MLKMMKYITAFDSNIPVMTSVVATFSSLLVAPRRCDKVILPCSLSSSTSWAACQKNRYGEMVVPNIPTSTAAYDLVHSICGMRVARITAGQARLVRKAVIT